MNKAFKINTILCLFFHFAGAQSDSLRQVLKRTNYNDTNRVALLKNIGEIEGTFRVSFWDSLSKECEAKLKTAPTKFVYFYKTHLAITTNNVGYVADELGDRKKAQQAYEKALPLFIELGDKKGLAKVYNNLGSIHEDIGDYKVALDYYYKSLKLREEIKDVVGLSVGSNNIGMIYHNQANYKKAIEFYENAALYALKGKSMGLYGVSLGNIGLSYSLMNERDRSLKYYLRTEVIQDSINDQFHRCLTLNNIAGVYRVQKKYDLALDIYEKSLHIIDSIGYARVKPVILNNIADIYLLLGKVDKARSYAEKGLVLAKEGGYPKHISGSSLLLGQIYERTGNYKAALENFKLGKKMADSLNNDDAKREALQKDLQYKYDKKSATDSLNMVLERRSNELRSKEEKTQRTILYGGLILTIGLGIFIFNRLRITRKQKQIISEQKLEVEEKNEQVLKQKVLVEEKQKEIVDSINYAKRIQQAVLTGKDVWQKIAKDHFILFQPKDIVSGDFYWATHTNSGLSVFALADCTGHGVPGGFMSMLGNSFLNEIVVEQKIYKPNEILDQLRNKIIKALAQEGQSNQKDGMDICLCTYDKKKRTLEFAGANNPLWIVNNNEVIEYKGDKMPIGVYVNELKPFSTTTIELNDGDCLYLITDGFADQFGGDKGKKFKYKPLMELLQKNHHRSMDEQGDLFLSVINEWKKGYEQVDDISLIGIRI